MTLLISDTDVQALWDPATLVDGIERGLVAEEAVGGPIQPGRMTLGGSEMFLRVMPAMLSASGLFGLKTFFGSVERGVRYVILLASMEDGAVLALVDAAFLTAARTGATSGAATRHLARPDTEAIGLIGSGLEAETNLLSVHAVRPAKAIRVFSPNPTRRAAFAERMASRLGIDVVACDAPEAAVSGTDIVVVATNTGKGGDVAYRGRWMEPGQHVVSIGSTAPWLREIDPETFRRADTVVFDVPGAQLAEESGDVAALVADRPDWDGGLPLAAVLANGLPASRKPDDVTLFKSVGAASQDLIAAAVLYQEALRTGRGRSIEDIAEPKVFV